MCERFLNAEKIERQTKKNHVEIMDTSIIQGQWHCATHSGDIKRVEEPLENISALLWLIASNLSMPGRDESNAGRSPDRTGTTY